MRRGVAPQLAGARWRVACVWIVAAVCGSACDRDHPAPADSTETSGEGSGVATPPALEGSAPAGTAAAPSDPTSANAREAAFFYQTRETAISALEPSADLPATGSVWSGDFTAFEPFAPRGLSRQAMAIFRQHDVIVMDGERTFAFALDRAPTRLQCNGLWPCVTVTAPDGTLSTLRFEVVRDAATGDEVLLALDCLERAQVAGGAGFPSDEQLLVNGGLVARHRTDTHLCVRRVNAAGPRRVAVAVGEGT